MCSKRTLLLAFLIICSLAILLGHNLPAEKRNRLSKNVKHKKTKRIVQGSSADIRNHPYHTVIERRLSGVAGTDQKEVEYGCGGAIISNQHILTASHCTKDAVKVKLGIDMLESAAVDPIVIESSSKHSEFITINNVMYNDIAVLKLAKKVPFSKSVKKVELPLPDEDPSNLLATLTGFGTLETNTTKPSDELMVATISVINHLECEEAFRAVGANVSLRDTNICSIDLRAHQGACRGDSGGPLVQDGKLIGVVSFGPNPCEVTRAPTVYTKVSKFVPWIHNKLARL